MGIVSRSPTRVDLAGGTLDIMPLTHILRNKKTTNVGVDLFAEAKIVPSENNLFSLVSHDQKVQITGTWEEVGRSNQLPWLAKLIQFFWSENYPALKIEVLAKSPAGAGLGGSSCLGICLASALLRARASIGNPLPLSEKQLVQSVQDLETSLIRVPTGCQDYWGGLRGGINILSYPPGGVQVETLGKDILGEMDQLLMLVYSGVSRASGSNNWAIFKQAFDGDRDILVILDEIADLSVALAGEVLQGRWTEVFKLSSQEWELRKRLWGDIETPETQRIAQAALKSGAMFSRICGAGGGGVMAIFAEKRNHESIIRAISEAGGKLLDARVSWEGTVVEGELYE